MADFDPTAKKKKVKKVTIAGDEVGEATTKQEALTEAMADTTADMTGGDAAELDVGKKKKKKPTVKKAGEDEADGAPTAAGDRAAVGMSDLIDYPDWPDYSYDELLTRVFNIMREKNPSLSTGESKRIQMKPPNVTRAGTKKTAFINFAEICRLLKRQPKHVMQFLMAELGTSGSVDGSNQLIIKGRFQQKHFETVLRKYIKEYVACHTCKSPETQMQKDGRLFFLQCETCGSRCSVAAIKTGFQAVTTKRAAIRAAAGQ